MSAVSPLSMKLQRLVSVLHKSGSGSSHRHGRRGGLLSYIINPAALTAPVLHACFTPQPSTAYMAQDRCFFRFAYGLLVASSIAIVHATRPSTSSKNACQSLVQSLGSKIQSDGAQYNASAHGAWNLFNQLDSERTHRVGWSMLTYRWPLSQNLRVLFFPRMLQTCL